MIPADAIAAMGQLDAWGFLAAFWYLILLEGPRCFVRSAIAGVAGVLGGERQPACPPTTVLHPLRAYAYLEELTYDRSYRCAFVPSKVLTRVARF